MDWISFRRKYYRNICVSGQAIFLVIGCINDCIMHLNEWIMSFFSWPQVPSTSAMHNAQLNTPLPCLPCYRQTSKKLQKLSVPPSVPAYLEMNLCKHCTNGSLFISIFGHWLSTPGYDSRDNARQYYWDIAATIYCEPFLINRLNLKITTS